MHQGSVLRIFRAHQLEAVEPEIVKPENVKIDAAWIEKYHRMVDADIVRNRTEIKGEFLPGIGLCDAGTCRKDFSGAVLQGDDDIGGVTIDHHFHLVVGGD